VAGNTRNCQGVTHARTFFVEREGTASQIAEYEGSPCPCRFFKRKDKSVQKQEKLLEDRNVQKYCGCDELEYDPRETQISVLKMVDL